MSMFYTGQKVVRVKECHMDKFINFRAIPGGIPPKNTPLLIIGFYQSKTPPPLGLSIAGYPSTWLPTGEEVGWDSSLFRPLQEMQDEAKAKKKQQHPTKYEIPVPNRTSRNPA